MSSQSSSILQLYSPQRGGSRVQTEIQTLASPSGMSSRLYSGVQQSLSPSIGTQFLGQNPPMFNSRQYQMNQPQYQQIKQPQMQGIYQQSQPQQRRASLGASSSQQQIPVRFIQQNLAQQTQQKILQLKGNSSLQNINPTPQQEIVQQGGLFSSRNSTQQIKQLKYEDVFGNQQRIQSQQSLQVKTFERSNSVPRVQPLFQSMVKLEPLSVISPNAIQEKQSETLFQSESQDGKILLQKLRLLDQELKQSTQQYQLTFQQKRMNSAEISEHKTQFKKQIQSIYSECQQLQNKYPSLLSEKRQSPNGQKYLNRVPSRVIEQENEINLIIDVLEETYIQYMSFPTKQIQSFLPITLQENEFQIQTLALPQTNNNLKEIINEERQLTSKEEKYINYIAAKQDYSPIMKVEPSNDEGRYDYKQSTVTIAQPDFLTEFISKDYSVKAYKNEIDLIPLSLAPLESKPFSFGTSENKTQYQGDNSLFQVKSATNFSSNSTSIFPISKPFPSASVSEQQINSQRPSYSEYMPKTSIKETVEDSNQNIGLTIKDININDYKPITMPGKKHSEQIDNFESSSKQVHLKIHSNNKDLFSGFKKSSSDQIESQRSNLIKDVEKMKRATNNSSWKTGEQIKGVEKLEEVLKTTQLLTLPKESEQLERMIKEEKFEEVSEYAYHILSDIDRKIIQIKQTIESTLNQTNMPMTKQLLVEIVDSLAETVKSCDEEVSQKAISKIHKNANRLIQDKSASYSLYIYLSKIQEFIKQRAHIVAHSQQAQELSLLNQTDASFWQNHQLNSTFHKIDDENKSPPPIELNIPFFSKNTSNISSNYDGHAQLATKSTISPSIKIQSPSSIDDKSNSYSAPLYQIQDNSLSSIRMSIQSQPKLNQSEKVTDKLKFLLKDSEPVKKSEQFSQNYTVSSNYQQENNQSLSNEQENSQAPQIVERQRISSYAVSNQISELNKVKQVAAQASAQQTLLETNHIKKELNSSEFLKQIGRASENQKSIIKMASPPLNSYFLSNYSNQKLELPLQQKGNIIQRSFKNMQTDEDNNSVASYEYSSSRPPIKSRVISQDQQIEFTNFDQNLTIQQKSKEFLNPSIIKGLPLQSSSPQQLLLQNKQEIPYQSPSVQDKFNAHTIGSTEISFAGGNYLNYTTSPVHNFNTQEKEQQSGNNQLLTTGVFSHTLQEVSNFSTENLEKQNSKSSTEQKQNYQTKMKFFDLAVKIKERYPSNHQAHGILISYLWDTAQKLAECQWEQFVIEKYNKYQ